ncbi:5-formyltetrahydrofolate cyclo-ligase [Streptococcus equinus]|uniref:5-formyltetrahydrofolate cyclo-ligase n=1 Tax=Streptococcus equinus TaxID=1335 RepID=UPI003BF7D189
MEKEALRKNILANLKGQDKRDKAVIDKALLDDFIQTKAYKEAKTIATYLAFDFEYDTQLLINQAQKDGKKILIPKTYPKGKMIFCAYDPEHLVKTKFGLWEPACGKPVDKSEIDLIHVPGVGFNHDGYRIGYGGGFYDRYLKDYKGNTISTIYDFQKADFQPDGHDVAVKEVLSR